MKNIELKAYAASLSSAREVCERLGADFQWVKQQHDIYYECAAPSRLKLRMEDNTSPYLVSYAREGDSGSMRCDYNILSLEGNCCSAARAFLESVFDVACEVRKNRELWMLGDTRIHLDTVKGLGGFIEFEQPFEVNAEQEARNRLEWLMREFGIAEGDAISVSYSNLLGME